MSSALTRRAPQTLAQLSDRWRRMAEDEQKRAAAQAANSKDPEELWNMTQAFMATHSSAGTSTSPATLRAYKAGITSAVDHWRDEGENLLRPTRDAGTAYREALRARGYSPATINQRLSAARQLWAALRHYGATQARPFDGVKSVRSDQAGYTRMPYPADALRTVLAALKSEEANARVSGDKKTVTRAQSDLRMVLLGADAGLRAAEMVSLKWRDVDPMTRSITVTGKGSKVRTVPCSPALWAELERGHGAPDAHVLVTTSTSGARYRLDRALQLAGVLEERTPGAPRGATPGGVDYGLHRLRHTFGTAVTDARGIHQAQVLLGHSSPTTTARYAHANQTRLAEAVAAASVVN